jgi:hypothetical protein
VDTLGATNVVVPATTITDDAATGGVTAIAEVTVAQQTQAVRAASAATTSTKSANRVSNAERAGERKFIESKIRGGRLSEDRIRQVLGDPDSYGSTVGTCLTPILHAPYECKLPTWIYQPSAQDQQTRTTITFTQDGEAIDVKRAIQY